MPCGCQTPVRMASIVWGRELAEVYDRVYASESEPAMLEPVLDILSDLAMGGGALEFAVGTGRVALPLSARGVPVRGLELSPHMVDQLLAKPGADIVPVTTGDMTTTRVPGTYRLVYLVANTLMNVTTQDEQLAVFENAAAHLEAGGCFVVELPVPQLPSVPRGEIGRVFTLEAEHVGIETFDDLVEQVAWSHHWMGVEGSPPDARGSVPLRLAVRAGPDGQTGRVATSRPVGGLAPCAVHRDEHEPGGVFEKARDSDEVGRRM
jgi:SAM-dependent methyltransferase